ncbi:matrilin-2 [Ahaetulla prasina]|uniref:matrilin-2 n=1 Tax=Ahaetulla prasina TaxID=499056 RepID=UPI0026480FAA|nr:matrilin-2 [Ahaetulla prasina]
MKRTILYLLLLVGLFPVSARERKLPRIPLSQRNDATFLENACSNKRLDLVFIIDSSRSVRPYDFEKVKEFILTILQFLDISPDNTRVGLIQYASTVKNEFSLKTFKKKQDVERAVKRMMYLATGTMTGLAIQYAMNIAFSEYEGARPLRENVPRVIMIVTDGRPQDPVAEIAAKTRNSGILIFAIGVGRVDMNTLKSIGSEPYEEHVFLVANFSQIESLTSVFQTKICVQHMCSITQHDCDHFCINIPGSYVCKCKHGYILDLDRRSCSIQDLCETEKHECEHICVNTPGSYVCQCYDGYELEEDGKNCFIVDYCALNNQGCQHECINTEDSYYCQCHNGFVLNPDKKTCKRPDHCALKNHGCQQECVNTDESYFCQCNHGFTLNPDKKTCKRINICSLGKHGCQHECVSTEESYMCKCQTGYILNRDGKTCRRIDHCAEFNHGCEQLCLNTRESYVCQCSEGFIINEDLKTCSRADYCLLNDHGCEHLCANTGTSYICQCIEGYVLESDGKACKRTDLCKLVDHGCEQLCDSDGESYVCKCHEGFILNKDRRTCRNQDVCKSIDHGCEHICVNINDSYVCECHEGFILWNDGKTCKRCNEGPIDLVFVIDGSKSLGENNFEIVKEFVLGILDSLTISPKAARIGLLQYSSHVRTEFTLKQFNTAKDMKKAVTQMKYMGKGSMTGLALKQMTERSFTEAEGARRVSANIPRVSVVFTDGRAQDDASEWAAKAKQSGITIYAVGIGKSIEEELRAIASEPVEKHIFYAQEFKAMEEITEKLQKRICEDLKDYQETTNQLHSMNLLSEEPEASTLAITDVLSCSNFAVHHKYLFKEKQLWTKASANPSDDKKTLCKCENLTNFQNFATTEFRKLIQQLEEMSKRIEALENRLRY